MKWLLIMIIVAYASDGGSSINTVVFNDRASCLEAGNAFLKTANDASIKNSDGVAYHRARARCVAVRSGTLTR
jgi:hypothetical protein